MGPPFWGAVWHYAALLLDTPFGSTVPLLEFYFKYIIIETQAQEDFAPRMFSTAAPLPKRFVVMNNPSAYKEKIDKIIVFSNNRTLCSLEKS